MPTPHGADSPFELWLIRHGETEWSLNGRHTGRTDLPLTANGERQATALGRQLGGRPFALVLTSPLSRARETCRLAGYGDVAIVIEDALEWDYGEYEGRTTADIRRERPGWSVFGDGVLGGEALEAVGARTRHLIERARGAGGDVAVFSHAHLLRILTACWLGLPPSAGRLFHLDTASVSVLGYERETPVILRWNHQGA